ncbi:hypothetical protein BDU57DRAFT_510362 [Ampelomyces quisqualis]|uniref:Fe2OG dioxygenase domain-containing protein n=1 Tax=Ampelomyces quisqualis TaxID=50730 RepID=A0A6A5R1F4_AMPQU|nr:hypothetical protein BDU57DRAFT_510362 [Ampelomyces quisqualis]
MSVLVPTKSSDQGFSISNIISRFRSKRGSTSKRQQNAPGEAQVIYQDTRPPLIPSPLPLVLPEHQYTLPSLGWTTITFPQPSQSPSSSSPLCLHPLQIAYENLFEASQSFFALPSTEKNKWKHKLGSEEGWSSIPGEKEFITLRTLEYCPGILRARAKTYWDLMGAYLEDSLGRIASSLSIPPEELQRFVGPCATFPATESDKTATMLRLFRYESWEPKVVAEPHADLGLLSVVVGNVPGLEVWDGHGWFDIEREVDRAQRRGASLLVGRQLERLSNARYAAGGHQVVSYGDPNSLPTGQLLSHGGKQHEKRYRFSIVFVLRAHEPVIIDSDKLETGITGKWEEEMKGVTAGKFYETIRGQHFNINIGIRERELQRRNIARKKEGKTM